MTIKVLVVDDSQPIRSRLIEMILENDCTSVKEANSARDGLKQFCLFEPDIIITDMFMPGMSGLKLIDLLSHQITSEKIIMLTNQATDEYKERCLESGADYFFDKSKEFDQVKQVLSELILQFCPA